jgi:hypothetical protein
MKNKYKYAGKSYLSPEKYVFQSISWLIDASKHFLLILSFYL